MDDFGCDDYFETHDCDDLQEFSDNEAWLDMRGELDEECEVEVCEDCGCDFHECICEDWED